MAFANWVFTPYQSGHHTGTRSNMPTDLALSWFVSHAGGPRMDLATNSPGALWENYALGAPANPSAFVRVRQTTP